MNTLEVEIKQVYNKYKNNKGIRLFSYTMNEIKFRY